MPKTILVVDDERALANTLGAILRHAGYEVLVTYNAAEAMEVMRATHIDLLVSDVVMPEMNGIELARRTSRQYPGVAILLISGNADTQQFVIDDDSEVRDFELLAKPVLPKQMLEQIRTMLLSSPQQQ